MDELRSGPLPPGTPSLASRKVISPFKSPWRRGCRGPDLDQGAQGSLTLRCLLGRSLSQQRIIMFAWNTKSANVECASRPGIWMKFVVCY